MRDGAENAPGGALLEEPRAEVTGRSAEETVHLLTSALQAAANGVVITDSDGTIRWVNDAFTRLTGYEASEVVGRNPRLLKSGAQGPALYEELWSTIRSGRIWRGSVVNRRKDGTLYSEDMTITPVRDATGAIANFIAIKEDITDRKRHEEALARAGEQHRLALDTASLGTFRHEIREGRIELDARAQAHLGIARAIVSLADMLATVHPDDLATIHRAIATAHDPKGDGRARTDIRIVSPCGVERYVSIGVQTYFLDDGRARVPDFTIGTVQDITDRKRTEAALRASEERYRALVDNLNEIVFSFDLEGRLTFVSRAVERFGYRPADMVGRSLDEFVHPGDREELRRRVPSRLGGVSVLPRDLRWYDAAGKIHYLQVTTRPLIEGTRVVGVAGLGADVTSVREAEERLREAHRMEAIGRLAGGVAHDFNNLLTVILSYAEFAVENVHRDDPLREDLEEVMSAARRAETLTRQLLAFSRSQVLTPEVVSLNAVVAKMSSMLERMIGEDVRLSVDADEALWTTRIDRGQFEQVLMNLAVNARDAMPSGGELRIRTANVVLGPDEAARLEVSPGDYAELSVADTGGGMPPEVRARIFEPFFTTKAVGRGTGLGLAMVHGIVKQSGGAIVVESAPERGTTFRILFPRGDEQDAAGTTRPPPRTAQGQEHILVVDDEPAVRNAVVRMLKAEGYEVTAASGGAEALACCDRVKPALVLTDVIMPEMSGCRLAEQLAARHPSVRVLFMSGYTDEKIEHHGILEHRLLRKPFDRATVARTVRCTLDANSCNPDEPSRH